MMGAGSCPRPPNPGEPVPSVPPIGEADGTLLRYGGLRAASCTRLNNIKKEMLPASDKANNFYLDFDIPG